MFKIGCLVTGDQIDHAAQLERRETSIGDPELSPLFLLSCAHLPDRERPTHPAEFAAAMASRLDNRFFQKFGLLDRVLFAESGPARRRPHVRHHSVVCSLRNQARACTTSLMSTTSTAYGRPAKLHTAGDQENCSLSSSKECVQHFNGVLLIPGVQNTGNQRPNLVHRKS